MQGMDQTLADTLTGWRRHIHANPELSLHEAETAAFVCARLQEMGIPFVSEVGGTGVVATISRGSSNRSVGLARGHGCAADHRENGPPARLDARRGDARVRP